MENKIPKETLNAATTEMLTRAGFNSADYPDVHRETHSRWITAQREALAILQAAGVPNLLDQIETYQRFDLRSREEWQALLTAKDARIAELEAVNDHLTRWRRLLLECPKGEARQTGTEFRLTGRDSFYPSGASLVSTMPPSPSGGTAKG